MKHKEQDAEHSLNYGQTLQRRCSQKISLSLTVASKMARYFIKNLICSPCYSARFFAIITPILAATHRNSITGIGS